MSRRESDYYPTPPECVHALMPFVQTWGFSYLEPCAGAGSIIKAAKQWSGRNKLVSKWYAYERSSELAQNIQGAEDVQVGDALAMDWHRMPVVANPPFSDMGVWVERIMKHCEVHKVPCAILTRCSWLLESGRYTVRQKLRGRLTVINMCWRPSFTGDGKFDNQPAVWLIYDPGRPKQYGEQSYYVEKPLVEQSLIDHHRAAARLSVVAGEMELQGGLGL